VRRLIVVARQWSERLDKPVRVWMSDKQDAFVTAIASEFPGTPHRYCQNHFLRDVAQPVLDMDSRAKVKMRRKVRGLRAIERRVIEERRQAAAPAPTPPDENPKPDETPRADPSEATAPRASSDLGWTSTDSTLEATDGAMTEEARGEDKVGEVVLGYCAAVRGILNDSQGGPLHPPGVRMREALQDVRDSLERNLQAQKGGLLSHC
jgi:ATP-dependent Clp protease ATP-binding subunit ClpA